MVDEDIQQAEGPSAQYGDNWDNQRVGGTVLDGAVLGGAEPVREVVERYKMAGVEVVKDTKEAEGRRSRIDGGQGSMRDGEGEHGGPFGK